jgi:hypothetical protein
MFKCVVGFYFTKVLDMRTEKHSEKKSTLPLALWRWFDTEAAAEVTSSTDLKQVDWFRILPFVIMHLMCLGVIWVGWSWFAVVTAVVLYFIRMFAITGFYHRYFSHNTFKTNRFWQFFRPARAAVVGSASSPSPPLRRYRKRYPFAPPAWIYLEPHRVVDVPGEFSNQNAICQRLGPVSGAALDQSF